MEQGLNLIQQLQTTPKWSEFKEWYSIYQVNTPHVPSLNTLERVPYELYKGVFEKFIESRGYNIEKQLQDISYEERTDMSEQKILELRYKEAWFIRTVIIVNDFYTPVCLNPMDNYLNRLIPFNSFEELLIWYFNN